MESPSARSPSACSTPTDLASPIPCQSNLSGKQPMSATLKERLKKTRRSFNSFSMVAKRLKVDSEENDNAASQGLSLLNKSTLGCNENIQETSRATANMKSPQQDRDCWRFKPRTSLQNTPQAGSSGIEHKQQELLDEKRRLVKQVQEKEELLRRLKMVKMYRSKNNLTELQSLIDKWRSSSQQLLYELQSALSTEGKKLSLSQLIDSCGLEDSLLHYNRADEDFEDP